MRKLIAVAMITALMSALLATFAPVLAIANDGDFDIGFRTGENGQLELDRKGSAAQTDGQTAWSTFITKYRNFIVGVSGIGAVTMVGVFILNFMKLGVHSTSNKRSDVLVGLIWSGAAAAGLGAVAFIVGFFYNAIT